MRMIVDVHIYQINALLTDIKINLTAINITPIQFPAIYG